MARLQISLPDHIKKRAEWILEEQGITPAVANSMFYIEIIHCGGLPFHPTPVTHIPNQLTEKTIENSRKGESLVTSKSKSDFFRKLKKI